MTTWTSRPCVGSPMSAGRILDAGTSVGIHFGTFRRADDGQGEPAERIEELLREGEPPPPRFWALGVGESRDVPAAEASRRIAR